MLDLRRTTSDNPDFQALVGLLNQDLAVRDGHEHVFYAQFNKLSKIGTAVVAYQQDRPVGCGALREHGPGEAEIKRMFVQPAYRGQGIARAILAELERWAQELNYPVCLLETGRQQPEAIRLYQRSGYAPIPNYGPYAGVASSVCMRKEVGALGA